MIKERLDQDCKIRDAYSIRLETDRLAIFYQFKSGQVRLTRVNYPTARTLLILDNVIKCFDAFCITTQFGAGPINQTR